MTRLLPFLIALRLSCASVAHAQDAGADALRTDPVVVTPIASHFADAGVQLDKPTVPTARGKRQPAPVLLPAPTCQSAEDARKAERTYVLATSLTGGLGTLLQTAISAVLAYLRPVDAP